MVDELNPLWLPKGSVRAILAISLIVTLMYLSITTGDIPDAVLGITSIIIGFYFGKRDNDKTI